MKHSLFFVAFAAAITLFPIGSNAKEPSKPTPKSAVIRAVPFANYWDAKAWDRVGGVFFWHKQTDERRTSTRKGKPAQPVPKKARASGDSPLSYR